MIKTILSILDKLLEIFLKKSPYDLFKDYNQIVENIDGELEDMRKMLNADYCASHGIHNGDVTINRLHMFKFTRLFEARRPGLPDKRPLVQGFNFAPFKPLYDKMISEGHLAFYYPEQVEDLYFRQLIFRPNDELMGTTSLYYFPLISRNGHPLGAMVVEFKKETRLTTVEIESIKKYAFDISLTLDNYTESKQLFTKLLNKKK